MDFRALAPSAVRPIGYGMTHILQQQDSCVQYLSEHAYESRLETERTFLSVAERAWLQRDAHLSRRLRRLRLLRFRGRGLRWRSFLYHRISSAVTSSDNGKFGSASALSIHAGPTNCMPSSFR